MSERMESDGPDAAAPIPDGPPYAITGPLPDDHPHAPGWSFAAQPGLSVEIVPEDGLGLNYDRFELPPAPDLSGWDSARCVGCRPHVRYYGCTPPRILYPAVVYTPEIDAATRSRRPPASERWLIALAMGVLFAAVAAAVVICYGFPAW